MVTLKQLDMYLWQKQDSFERKWEGVLLDGCESVEFPAKYSKDPQEVKAPNM